MFLEGTKEHIVVKYPCTVIVMISKCFIELDERQIENKLLSERTLYYVN